MKKQILITCFILGVSLNSQAQQGIQQKFTRTDTVRAIHNMFSKHRTGGIIWTAIGSAFAVRIVSVAANSGATDGFSSTAAGTAVGVALFGGLPAGIGIGKLTRFGSTREKRIAGEYEAGKTLPTYVQHRLKKSKYFTR